MLTVYTSLWNTCLERFHLSELKLNIHWRKSAPQFPLLPSTPAPAGATTFPRCVSESVTTLGSSRKGNQAVFALCGPAYFTQVMSSRFIHSVAQQDFLKE